MHVYSMKGCNRENYVFYLTIMAFAVVEIINQAAGCIGVVVTIAASTVFAALFYVFDKWIWKLPWITSMIGTPDLSGAWIVTGSTNGTDGVIREWNGTLTIEQTWSHIAISIETEQSRSRSTMASLERDPGFGYRLIYSYVNNRKLVDSELQSHNGTCEVVFANELQNADALYFNDHQRRTIGTMKWTRQLTNKGYST